MRRQMLVRMNSGATGGCARLLANGNEMPVLGLAVWQVPVGARVSCSYSLSSTGRGLRAARESHQPPPLAWQTAVNSSSTT